MSFGPVAPFDLVALEERRLEGWRATGLPDEARAVRRGRPRRRRRASSGRPDARQASKRRSSSATRSKGGTGPKDMRRAYGRPLA